MVEEYEKVIDYKFSVFPPGSRASRARVVRNGTINSDTAGFIREDEDGDSYKYSDGSGYYHGSDGSEGYI